MVVGVAHKRHYIWKGERKNKYWRTVNWMWPWMQLTICQRGTVGFEPTNQTVWAHHCLPYVSASSRPHKFCRYVLQGTTEQYTLVQFWLTNAIPRNRTASLLTRPLQTSRNRTYLSIWARNRTLHNYIWEMQSPLFSAPVRLPLPPPDIVYLFVLYCATLH